MRTSNTWFDDLDQRGYSPSYYTIKYTTSAGTTVYQQIPYTSLKRKQEPELEAGDTAELDNFLGGFGNAKE